MRNISKKVWSAWGIVTLTLLLNIAIITVVNNKEDFPWLLIISIAVLMLALYNALSGSRSFLSFIKSSQSLGQHPQKELLSHSIYPTKITKDDLRVLIGNEQCSKPYNACLLSIEGWENTNYRVSQMELNGKESETPGRIKLSFPNKFNSSSVGSIWQVDATYQGCRTENGNFDSLAFKRIAGMPGVKMIEINLNSSVNRDYWAGSILEITKPTIIKGKPDLFTGSGYTTFCDAEGLVHFIESLRNLSSGKPVGIRLSINNKKDFHKICHAIRKTQIIPDFIVVEGSTERVRIVHSALIFCPEMPLYEALSFVSQTLQAYALDSKIKLIAAGKIISAFDILKLLALGANAVCTAMPAYDQIKYPCNGKNVSSLYKSHNALSIHDGLMKGLVQIMKIGGFMSVSDITLSKFFSRLDVLRSKNIHELNGTILYPGSVKKVYNSKNKSYPIKRKEEKSIM